MKGGGGEEGRGGGCVVLVSRSVELSFAFSKSISCLIYSQYLQLWRLVFPRRCTQSLRVIGLMYVLHSSAISIWVHQSYSERRALTEMLLVGMF